MNFCSLLCGKLGIKLTSQGCKYMNLCVHSVYYTPLFHLVKVSTLTIKQYLTEYTFHLTRE